MILISAMLWPEEASLSFEMIFDVCPVNCAFGMSVNARVRCGNLSIKYLSGVAACP